MPGHGEEPTTAERAVLRAVEKHGTVKGAAEDLCISPHTLRAHLGHLYNKTGLHNKTQLVLRAMSEGWLAEEEQE
jgi:DNA-binding NarL/FixJ family response regulator